MLHDEVDIVGCQRCGVVGKIGGLVELDLLRTPEVIAESDETVCGTYQNLSGWGTEDASCIGKTVLRPWHAVFHAIEV